MPATPDSMSVPPRFDGDNHLTDRLTAAHGISHGARCHAKKLHFRNIAHWGATAPACFIGLSLHRARVIHNNLVGLVSRHSRAECQAACRYAQVGVRTTAYTNFGDLREPLGTVAG